MLKARFTKEIGIRAYLRIYWGEKCSGYSTHNAIKHIVDSDKLEDWKLGGKVEDWEKEDFPTHCRDCGIEVPKDENILTKQVFHKRLYDTPSGELEPGCLYWNTWFPEDFYWSNHKGAHLMAILPNGSEWNIDSRASNCTMKDDKIHRCWCRRGNPETDMITVDKSGVTCQAGAGSIGVEGYHGFLKNGSFT